MYMFCNCFKQLNKCPHLYSSFSGALGSSNSSFNNLDHLRQSSSSGQARSYTSSPLGALRPKMFPSGNRLLHTSRPLSAPVANRPLSPHLPLKKPQLSATFSISHRIFGAALGAVIISIPLATKFSLMFDVWERNVAFISWVSLQGITLFHACGHIWVISQTIQRSV